MSFLLFLLSCSKVRQKTSHIFKFSINIDRLYKEMHFSVLTKHKNSYIIYFNCFQITKTRIKVITLQKKKRL